MILIPRKLKRRRTSHSQYFWHYELLEDKCTKRLAVYRCVETGCIESFQKKDFEVKDLGYDLKHVPKYERSNNDNTV